MNTEPQMTDLPAEKQATKAIGHVLRRIADVPPVAYYCGHGSQTYALLLESMATLTGKTVEELQRIYPPAQPRELEERELRECPFCGSSFIAQVIVNELHFAECGDCKAHGPKIKDYLSDDPEAEAREKWNDRAVPRF